MNITRSHDKKVQIQGLESLKKYLSFETSCGLYMTNKNSGFRRKHREVLANSKFCLLPTSFKRL